MTVSIISRGTTNVRLKAAPGIPGPQGNQGWAPEPAVVADGVRRVLQVIDWAGGEGPKPATGGYVGADGLVTDIADAVDIRGAQGQKGWSPQFSLVADGARRVLRLTGWTGGEGGAPATGSYVGATGLVPNIVDAIDIRGPAGPPAPADSIDNALLANMPTGRIKGRAAAGTGDPEDLTAAQVVGLLPAFTGAAGAGSGAKGLVPAPAAGDGAAKFLKADGTWATPTGQLPAQFGGLGNSVTYVSPSFPMSYTSWPTSVQGILIASRTITLASDSSRIRLQAVIHGTNLTAGTALIGAIFRGDAFTTAIVASCVFSTAAGHSQTLVLDRTEHPLTAGPVTYHLRVGVTGGSGFFINGQANGVAAFPPDNNAGSTFGAQMGNFIGIEVLP